MKAQLLSIQLHSIHSIMWLSQSLTEHKYIVEPFLTSRLHAFEAAGWHGSQHDIIARCQQRELMHISRDALAGVLGVTGERGTRIEGVRCIDLRRHDERALYGSIPGAQQVSCLASTLDCFLHAAVLDTSG